MTKLLFETFQINKNFNGTQKIISVFYEDITNVTHEVLRGDPMTELTLKDGSTRQVYGKCEFLYKMRDNELAGKPLIGVSL